MLWQINFVLHNHLNGLRSLFTLPTMIIAFLFSSVIRTHREIFIDLFTVDEDFVKQCNGAKGPWSNTGLLGKAAVSEHTFCSLKK